MGKLNNKFKAQISIKDKKIYLGLFSTEGEAYQSYMVAKINHIKSFYKQVPKRVRKGLKRHIKILKEVKK